MMRMTWSSRAVVLPLVLSCCRAQDSLQCHKDGPEGCGFQYWDPYQWNSWTQSYGVYIKTLCSWTGVGGWAWGWSDSSFYYPGMSNANNSSLSSRLSCSTLEQTYCLSFWFKFTLRNSADLNVYLRNVENGRSRKVWSLSSAISLNWWYDAFVPIKTKFPFIVEIEAVRHHDSQSNDTVGIDNIVYQRSSPALCILSPPNAKVLTPTTAATTAPSLTTSIMVHTTTTPRIISPTVTTTLVNPDKTITTKQPPSVTGNRTRHTQEADPSTNVVSVIGGVITAVVVIIIVVVLFILYKRHKLQTFTNCFNQQKQTETFHTRAAHNVAYNPEAIGIEESAIVCSNGSTNQACASENSRHSSGDYYSTIHSDYGAHSEQNSSTSDAYASVNKLKGVQKHVNQPENSNYQTPEASGGIYHVPQNINTKEQSNPGSRITDEYNELDYDGKWKCVQDHTDGEAGAVYSHLRKGDEDAYNEVDRERRTDVIGDEYSHVQ